MCEQVRALSQTRFRRRLAKWTVWRRYCSVCSASAQWRSVAAELIEKAPDQEPAGARPGPCPLPDRISRQAAQTINKHVVRSITCPIPEPDGRAGSPSQDVPGPGDRPHWINLGNCPRQELPAKRRNPGHGQARSLSDESAYILRSTRLGLLPPAWRTSSDRTDDEERQSNGIALVIPIFRSGQCSGLPSIKISEIL